MDSNLSQFKSVSPRPKVIIFTSILHLAVLLVFLPHTFSWSAVGVAVFLHWITIGLGISFGFHRLAAHRSLQTPKWLEYLDSQGNTRIQSLTHHIRIGGNYRS